MKKILIVDDSEADCFLMTSLIEASAPEVMVLSAYDGHEALQILEQDQTVSLIICDLHMPRMSGTEFLESCQAKGLDIPAVVVSGLKHNKDKNLQKKYDYLTEVIEKPLERNKLLQILATHIKE